MFMSFFPAALCGFGENAPSSVASVSDAHFRKAYVVTPGDHLDIVVRRVPEASRSVVVRSDGEITLPMVKDVAVAGLTTEEVNTKLVSLFSRRLIRPDVTVIATDVREPTVYIGGEVNNAGAIPLRRAATAIQAISLSGGLKRSAASRNIVIIRLGDDGKLMTIPIQADVHGQRGPYEALAKTRLFPDDIIFVPENGRSRLSRFLDDFINRPLTGVNSVLGTYVNFRLVQEISRVAQ
jgi:protein involved in polysaccharide export with SLBB domain